MFDQCFDFKFIQKRKSKEYGVLNEFIYSFNSSKRRYIVLVEEYGNQVFVPKFYPSTFRNSPYRFNILLNDFEAPRIIRTCINITIKLLKANPSASFAFMGANSIQKNKTEPKILTKRFRIYRRLMFNFFKRSRWAHFDDINTSTYLLIPKSQQNIVLYAQSVLSMFAEIYPFLERIEFP